MAIKDEPGCSSGGEMSNPSGAGEERQRLERIQKAKQKQKESLERLKRKRTTSPLPTPEPPGICIMLTVIGCVHVPDKNENEPESFCSFWIKPVTNEPGPQYYDTLKDRFICYAKFPERTKVLVFVFVFVFVLGHEQRNQCT